MLKLTFDSFLSFNPESPTTPFSVVVLFPFGLIAFFFCLPMQSWFYIWIHSYCALTSTVPRHTQPGPLLSFSSTLKLVLHLNSYCPLNHHSCTMSRHNQRPLTLIFIHSLQPRSQQRRNSIDFLQGKASGSIWPNPVPPPPLTPPPPPTHQERGTPIDLGKQCHPPF